jgi:hypothetical protein
MEATVIDGKTTGGVFPFKLDDLKAWIVHRKDGTVTKFTLVQSVSQRSDTGSAGAGTGMGGGQRQHVSVYRGNDPYRDGSGQMQARLTTGFAGFCTHLPDVSGLPEAQFTRADGTELQLWVASVVGARGTKQDFDFVVDCGDIFEPWQMGGMLEGDVDLTSALSKYVEADRGPRLLKVDWDDRQAPKVSPEFWMELNRRVSGRVMTACIGGHGRSGTSFVCLLLANAPDYDALDAIVHLRAVHCPRAIESQVQHDYIDRVAAEFGRTANAKQAHTVTDYKAAFKASDRPTAVRTRKLLGWDK